MPSVHIDELVRADRRRYEAALVAASVQQRIRVDTLNLDGDHLATLDAVMLDGQVNVDMAADGPTRTLSMSLHDPDFRLHLDSDSPSSGALFLDRMLRVVHATWVDALGSWVNVDVFTGPIVSLSRQGPVVDVEGAGKEYLSLQPCDRPLTLPKGGDVVKAIRRVMVERGGEFDLNLLDLKARLPKALSLGRKSIPWKVAQRLAGTTDRQLFYNGSGTLVLRGWPGNPRFVFDKDWVLGDPAITFDAERVRNRVYVEGGKPKGIRKRFDQIPDDPKTNRDESKTVSEQVEKTPNVQGDKTADRSHPLSPWRLGRHNRDGDLIPRFLVERLELENIRTRKGARIRAARKLDDLLREAVDVQFDSVPVPHLQPGDLVTVRAGDFARDFRLRAFTIPLLMEGAPPMSIGYHQRVSTRRGKIRRGRR